MYKEKLFKLIIIIYLACLFIFPISALQGASNGLILWFEKILPTLLPLIILSNIIINTNILENINPFIYALVFGMLTGLPMGAKISNDLYDNKKITEKQATFLLTLCSNPSPMFIINYITIVQLKLIEGKYHILLITLLSSFISTLIIRYIYIRFINNTYKKLHICSIKTVSKKAFNFQILDLSIMNGFETITKIGGYIVLFSILVEFIYNLKINSVIKYFIIGVIEITNGINKISISSFDLSTKIKIIATITSFSGFSGLAQTYSVLNKSKSSINLYIISKIISAIIAYLLACFYCKYILVYII